MKQLLAGDSPSPDAAQRASDALLIRGPSSLFWDIAFHRSRICIASFHAALRPGHERKVLDSNLPTAR
jgi:hypothetical protein